MTLRQYSVRPGATPSSGRRGLTTNPVSNPGAGFFVRAVINGKVNSALEDTINTKLTWYDHTDAPDGGAPREIVTEGAFKIQEHSDGKAVLAVRPGRTPLVSGVYRWKLDIEITQKGEGENSPSTTKTITTQGETPIVVEQTVKTTDFPEATRKKFNRTSPFGDGFRLAGVPSIYLDDRGGNSNYADDRIMLSFPGQSPVVFDLRPLSEASWTYDGVLRAIAIGANATGGGDRGFDDAREFGTLRTREDGTEMIYQTGAGVEYVFKRHELRSETGEISDVAYFIDRIEQPGLDFDPAAPLTRRGISFHRLDDYTDLAAAERIQSIVASDGATTRFDYNEDGHVAFVHLLDANSEPVRSVELKYKNSTLEQIVHSVSLSDTSESNAIRTFGYSGALMTNDTWWDQEKGDDGKIKAQRVRETSFKYTRGMITGIIQGSSRAPEGPSGAGGQTASGSIVYTVTPTALAGTAGKAGKKSELTARVAVPINYEKPGEKPGLKAAQPHLATEYLLTEHGRLLGVKDRHLKLADDEITDAEDLGGSKYVLDALGAVKLATENGRSTYFRYDYEQPVGTNGYSETDYRGNVLQVVTNSTLTTFAYELDANLQVGSLIQASTGDSMTVYDRLGDGRIEDIITTNFDNSHSFESWTYHPNGLLESHTSPLGLHTAFVYYPDSTRLHERITTSSSLVTKEIFEYDDRGSVDKITTETNGHTTGIEEPRYDGLGRLRGTTTSSHDGTVLAKSSINYSADGYVTELIDGRDTVSRNVHDTAGLLRRTVDAVGEKADSEWLDKKGISIEHVTSYGYYSDGAIKTTTNPDGSTITSYLSPTTRESWLETTGEFSGVDQGEDGTLKMKEAPDKTLHSTLDPLGRLVQSHDSQFNTETIYKYRDGRTDAATKVTSEHSTGSMRMADQLVREYHFDGLGRTIVSVAADVPSPNSTRKTARQLPVRSNKFDGYGALSATRLHAAYGEKWAYINNAAGLPTEAIETRRGPDNASATFKTVFRYDESGRLLSTIDPLNQARLLEEDDLDGLELGTVAATTAFSVEDHLLKQTDTTRTNLETHRWYDAAGQLVKIQSPLGGLTEFDYDLAGNQTETVATAYVRDGETDNVLPVTVTTANTYDELGRLTSSETIGGDKSSKTSNEYWLPKDSGLGWRVISTAANGNRTASVHDSAGRHLTCGIRTRKL